MSKFKLSNASLGKLQGVHPDLVAVVKRAIELTPYDFGVTEGVRSVERQKALYDSGASTTMNSKHIVNAKTGYGHAVDLKVYLGGGQITWDHKYFRKVIQAVFTAAIELGVQVEAGALWRDFLDSPHIQLNDRYYK